jgi:serine/threonine-protein kinase
MFAAAFDLGRLEMRGAPAPVVEGIAVNAGTSASQVGLSGPTSGSGVMAYLEGQMTASLPIVWLDAAGKEEPLVAATAALALDPRFSPDGKRLAVSSAGDIYIYDVGRGALQKITNSAGASYPVWSPDGSHIVYGNSGGLVWIRADGSGQPLQIYGTTAVPGSISPDGRNIGFHQAGSGTSRDLWILPLDTTDPDHPKPGTPELFLATKGADIEPAFSPDGRWLAYSSNESGTYQVFVRPFPGGAEGGGQTQLSLNGGRFPVWSRTAKEIYYADPGGHIMAVPYTISGRTFNPGKPRQWSDTHISLMGNNTPLDLAPDGKRFAIYPAQTADSNGKTNLHAVFLLNFFDEVARRIPR